MAKFNVVDMNGQHVSEIELSDAVFGITPNEKAVHIAVGSLRPPWGGPPQQGDAAWGFRGGAKPLASEGHRPRSSGLHPCSQWTHGGVALGPKPRSYNYHQQQGQAPGSAERSV